MLILVILTSLFALTTGLLLFIYIRQRARISHLVLDTTILSRICDLATNGASSLSLTQEGRFIRDWARAPILDSLGIDFASINDFESFSKIIMPEDLPNFRQELAKLLTGQEVSCIFRVRASDGGIRWLKDIVSPERDSKTGRVQRLISVVQDVTAEQETINVLRRVERRHDEMFRNSSDSIFIVRLGDAGEFFYENFNPMYEQVTGLSALSLIGRTPHECLPTSTADQLVKYYNDCLLANGPITYEEELDLPSGYQAALTLLIPLRDHTGNIESIFGFSRFITQRKLAEEELRKSREKYRNIFEESPVGIFQSSLEGKFLSVNPELARIFEYDSPEDMIAAVTDIKSQIYQSALERERLISRVLSSSVSLTEEVSFVKRGGQVFPGRIIIKAVRDGSGGVQHLFGHVEDMTEIRKVEDERSRLSEQLRHAQRIEAIGRLAGAVAHDFNNLLSPILGYAELLISTPGTEAWSGELQLIRDTATRAAGVTRQLLTFSRKQPINLVEADACAIVRNFLPLLQRMGGENIKFVVEYQSAEAPIIVDTLQIEQVLLNLALNAVDAMQGKGQVTITVRATDHFAVLEVGDTGCGFDQEIQKQIFEPFFTTKQPGTGTGLGLPIVASIVEQHEGYLEVKSTPGIGSVFSVFLPLVTKTEEQEQDAADGKLKPAIKLDANIVVVEDEEAVVDLVRDILLRTGYRVQVYQDATRAIEALKAGLAVDLVITDVMMPGMAGDVFAQNLHDLLPEVPLLFISGYADSLLVERGRLSQHAEFLQKPFSIHDLLAMVAKLLEKNKRAGRDYAMA